MVTRVKGSTGKEFPTKAAARRALPYMSEGERFSITGFEFPWEVQSGTELEDNDNGFVLVTFGGGVYAVSTSTDYLVDIFGAIPTTAVENDQSNSTVNMLAIEAAHDYAVAMGGGRVVFSPGIYYVNHYDYPGLSAAGRVCILARNDVDIVGAGRAATTIKITDGLIGGAGTFGRIIGSLGENGLEAGLINCTIRDLTVDGNVRNNVIELGTFTTDYATDANLFTTDSAISDWATFWPVTTPVQFTSTGTLPSPLIQGKIYFVTETLSDTTFEISDRKNGDPIILTDDGIGTHSYGKAALGYANILLETSSRVKIDNVRSQNAHGEGMMVRGQPSAIATNVEISNVSVGTVGRVGVQVSQAQGFLITDSFVDGCGDNCYDWYGDDGSSVSTTTGWVVSNCVARNGNNGFFPETSADGVITGCVAKRCNYGFHPNRKNGAPDCVRIDSCQALDCYVAGLWHTGDNTSVIWSNNTVRGCTAGIKLGQTTGGNVSGVVGYNNFFEDCDTVIDIIANNVTYVKLFKNFGRDNTTWLTTNIVGTETSVYIEDELDITRAYTPHDWRNLAANSTSNVTSRASWFRDTNGTPFEFGRLEFNSSIVTAGNKQGTLRLIVKDANSDVTPVELIGSNVLMSTLPTSSAGLPTGALWNNAGVINIV